MKTITVVLAFAFFPTAWAQTLERQSFKDVWKAVQANSGNIRAVGHEVESARINSERSARHWYPRIYADARAFVTNDPGMSFLSLLGQRQITASDFNPAELNNPPSRFYQRGTLGLDLPIFEGGARVSASKASENLHSSKIFERTAVQRTEYAQTAGDYVTLVSLRRQYRELESLKSRVTDILGRYHIGQRSNPVGYSGLLGLKNLNNRIDGLIAENESKQEAVKTRIESRAQGMVPNWAPVDADVRSLLSEIFRSSKSSQGYSRPAAVESAVQGAVALEKVKDAERAKFLPRVGLFAEGNLYNGSRDSATGYSTGAYVQWDLFNAPNFGAIGQAQHSAAAASARADMVERNAKASFESAAHASRALENNLNLMSESSRLLNEQADVARTLFRNGSISALQLVEVLARHVDLTVSRAEAEAGLAQTQAMLFVSSSNGELPNEK